MRQWKPGSKMYLFDALDGLRTNRINTNDRVSAYSHYVNKYENDNFFTMGEDGSFRSITIAGRVRKINKLRSTRINMRRPDVNGTE